VTVIAVAYLVLHLPFLAPSLEDIDSINFALGLHRFDIVQHQPHPPGYPVYILLGRVSLWLIAALSTFGSVRADALALAVWSVIGGLVAIAGAARLFTAIEHRFGDPGQTAVWPVALLAASPLFWMSGLRPMSDMPGLAAVLWSQALLVEGMSDRRRAMTGALLAAATAGIRIQTLALTTPVLVLTLIYQHRAGAWWLLSRLGGSFAVGLAAWAVPLLRASGGLSGYLSALGTQAGEDFAWVNMLWSNPTPRRLAFNLYETFVLPWHSGVLAACVGLAAMAGGIVAIRRTPRAAFVMAFAFVPYLGYHLLLQETITVRYALPLMPLVAWLAMRGVRTLSGARWPGYALIGAALIVAVSGGVAYGRQAHPAYLAVAEAAGAAQLAPPAKVFAHFGLRRSLQHGGVGLPFVEPRREYEWLGPVDYWRGGGAGEIWFFAESRRTDLALIDPGGRRNVRRYGWPAERRGELSGTRPTGVEWYRMAPPGWFAGEGWSLTPETGGITRAAGSGPGSRPIEVFVKRRPERVHLVIGGRHLGEPGGADAELQVLLDGQPFERWTFRRADESFLRFLTLPAGVLQGASTYATLTIVSQAVSAGTTPEVAIRQFDAQSETGIVYGFGEGWHEPEYATDTGLRWRWTSERSVLHLRGTPQELRLTLIGESPLKYFDAPPTIRVTSNGQLIREFQPDADFEMTINLAPTVWRDGAASIAIESDRVYLPGVVEGTADERHLGLRLFDARIDTELP
jgi:hypothetical protein